MEDRKEKTKFWQGWMTIAILLGVAIIVVWFNSQGPTVRSKSDENISIANSLRVPIGDNKNVQIGNDKNIPVSNNENIPIVNGSNSLVLSDGNVSTSKMDNDTFFKTWISMSSTSINDNLRCISDAGYRKDFLNIERCGRLLRDNSNLSLRDIDRYSESSSFQRISDEYRQALEDYNVAGTNLEIGAKNQNMSQMAIGSKYIKSGNVHVEAIKVLINGNVSNFTHPKTVANTT